MIPSHTQIVRPYQKWAQIILRNLILLRTMADTPFFDTIDRMKAMINALADGFLEVILYLDNQECEELTQKKTFECDKSTQKGECMDKAIKSAKKDIDKKMDNLVRMDVKRDKKCDKAEHEAKAKKMKKK